METFGQVIVKARKAAGLTQQAVAERLRRGDGRKWSYPVSMDGVGLAVGLSVG